MFFEVPDWSVGKPVSEEEVIKARKEEAQKLRGNKPEKKVSFAEKPIESPSKKKMKNSKPEAEMPVSAAVAKPVAKVSSGDTSESAKLKAKLSGSRFRFLNQRLYESDSKEALSYFQEHQDDFLRYHEGFQEQTKKWPTNPVDIFIKDLSHLVQKKASLVVADLGCGEGKLGLSVMEQAGRLNKKGIVAHSFDLVAVGAHVKVASMTNVPLESSSVDIAIFSLSLMNTDFSKALLEANRILKQGASLWVAEVESRFEGGFAAVDSFVKDLKDLGFNLEGKVDYTHKVFVMMKFTKVKAVKSVPKQMSLKACMYKKR